MAFTFGVETCEGGSLPASFDSATGTIDSTSKVRGTYSVIFHNTAAGNYQCIKALGSDATELWISVRGFLPVGFAFGASGYCGLISLRDSSENELVTINIEDYGDTVVVPRLTLGGDIAYTDTGVDLPIGSVFKLEIYVKKSATVGLVKIWLNTDVEGSPTYNSGNKNTGATAFRKVAWGKTYVPESMSDYYLDDFAFNNAFIGATSEVMVQNSYRFRNDDGNETGATWLAALNTAINLAKTTATRIRVLLNTTGNYASVAPQLEYRKKDYGEQFKKVLAAGVGTASHTLCGTPIRVSGSECPKTTDYDCGTGATLLVVTIVSAGTGAGALRQGTNGLAPTYGGRLLTQGNSTQGGATEYETACSLWYLIDPPPGVNTLSVPNTRPNTIYVVASSYKAADGYTSALDDNDGTGNTGSTNPTVTSTPTVDGDVIVAVSGQGYDSAPSGRTGTVLFETDDGAYSDNHQYYLQATAAAFAMSWTQSSDDWCIVACAFKCVAITEKIQMKASANITASGDNTTAQLTAPNGKTTGDFSAGRMQDDENPADAVDLAADKYTEYEWCIQLTNDA
jgi:hypothetical protein